ncbi:MAG TPA: glycosyltransferase [Thermoanaerobaculia bacterium]|nr:glycosyltransferase [Thermoanaerobaculia bacterium]
MTPPLVSVVVPVLDRERDIGRCVEALLDQDYPRYEVLVVDNNSRDGTREVVRRYPVQLLEEPRRNPYTARNRGVAAAKGEIVAFTDSDCAPTREWLRLLVDCYGEPGVGGAGGALAPLPPATVVERFLALGRLQIFEAARHSDLRRDPRRFLSGGVGSANMSYRRQVLTSLGGFDDRFARFCGSYDLCWRVQAAGYRVVFEPGALVHHRMRGSLVAMCRQFFSFGIGQIHLFRRWAPRETRIQLRSYLLPPRELQVRSPLPAWVSLDAAHAALLALAASAVWPRLLIAGLPLALAVAAGALAASHGVVRRTGATSWYLLFPLLHLVRVAALTAGRIAGGLRHRVLAL